MIYICNHFADECLKNRGMRTIVVFVLILINFSFNTYAQRIKYKNLFPILQTKDYKTAEPQLLKFLEDNDDEANAYFYLGEIISSKLDTIEIFPSTQRYDSMANMAITAYKKAINLVDDREVRKNDEYYAAYNRRDLRTGKFEIKKSDIHLDYENKIKSISNRQGLVKELHELKKQTEIQYNNLIESAKNFYEPYPNETAYILRASSVEIESSKELTDHYDSFIALYQNFIDKMESFQHPHYNPELKIIEISSWEGLKPINSELVDFSINIQNYNGYLKSLNEKIEKEVRELKTLLFKTNTQFNEAINQNKMALDSTQIQDLNIPEPLEKSLATFDKSNSILQLLKYKKLKGQSVLLSNQNIYPVLGDSSNIYQRANLVEEYEQILAQQYELINKIEKNLGENTIKNYKVFLEEFTPSIEAYLKTEKTVLKQKLDSATQKSELMVLQIQYFNYKKDSIFLTPLIAARFGGSNYVINSIELDSALIVAGVLDNQAFIASAGFDMNIQSLEIVYDSTFTISNMLLLDDNILLNLRHQNQDNFSQISLYFSPKLEEIWTLNYESESKLGDAKVEAGIFFLYDEEGKVLQTLNSQVEIIGN
jgi:hypothetical protein